MTTWKPVVAIAAALLLSGCSTSFGVHAVPEARIGYNQSITQSGDEQMLLNLVRLRYRDSVTFLELSSVVTQYGYSGGVGANVTGPLRNFRSAVGGISGAVDYEERPTVAYEPLQGSEFAQRMLTPIAPDTIVLMSQSGWSIERLLLCCVERLNDLTNGPSASGPTPRLFPDNRAFRDAAQILRRLQAQDVLSISMNEIKPGELKATLALDPKLAQQLGLGDQMARAKQLIGLAQNKNSFTILGGAKKHKANEISMKGRSLLGVLYTLSHTVDVPSDHAAGGLVTVSAGDAGASWRQDFMSDTFGIQVSTRKPSGAFVAVPYRDHWYWIADNDLDAKTTFSLLKFLSSLQSAAGDGVAPLLTLSAGR